MEADKPPDAALVARAVEAAQRARERAYAPYSNYAVGAAVVAGPEIFSACNVENASYGASMCAERAAVFSAVAAGRREIDGIAIVTDAEPPSFPCGQCRQVLHEFNPRMWVAVAGLDDPPTVVRLADLFPRPFGPTDLVSRQTMRTQGRRRTRVDNGGEPRLAAGRGRPVTPDAAVRGIRGPA